ncbi:lactonase family protein [Vibrio gallicus]|uniref:lactonase family protein n=1 Tax=Vibrio gallicus TaxID=190897 RepID=UPI0021C3CBC1|nr:lactonase family protein [Vibrio gallicus]
MNGITLLVGCYTSTNSLSQGVQSVNFNTISGAFSSPTLEMAINNPSFVISDKLGYYAISEVIEDQAPFIAYSGSATTEQAGIKGDHPCHIAKSNKLGLIVTSQYTSGGIDIFRLAQDGDISHKLTTLQFSGSSTHPRQESPHAHQSVFLNTCNQLATVDLGCDLIRFFSISPKADEVTFKPVGQLILPAGSGPRHIVFNQSESMIYVLCELTEQIVVGKRIDGEWIQVQQIDLLPNTQSGEAGAAIKLSTDGRYIYTSSRAQSKISLFEVESGTGHIRFIESYPTHGEFPRDFTLVDNGNWVVAANQHTNNLTSFKRDPETGKLTFSGHQVQIGEPVCVCEV